MEREELYQAPYIVWVHYLGEGWSPRPQASLLDAVQTVLDGDLGGPCVITSGAFLPVGP